jgi:hypothetical protein
MVDEERVTDPTIVEPDLRMTMREWVLYWKSKYEHVLMRVVEANKVIEELKSQSEAKIREVMAQNKILTEQVNAHRTKPDHRVAQREHASGVRDAVIENLKAAGITDKAEIEERLVLAGVGDIKREPSVDI